MILPLGGAEEIETLIARWREEASLQRNDGGGVLTLTPDNRAERSYRDAGDDLRRRIWDPLGPHIAGLARVFVIPAAALNMVNLAALPVGEDQYLIEQDPLIHYLPTEREVVASENDSSAGQGLLAVGGVAFGPLPPTSSALRAPIEASGSDHRSTTSAPALSENIPFYGTRSACREFQSMQFEALPATTRETDNVSRAFCWQRPAVW